jgi:hypothetical protein
MAGSKWKCPQCTYKNEEEISRAVIGDTNDKGWTCIICYNLHLQSSDEVIPAKKELFPRSSI